MVHPIQPSRPRLLFVACALATIVVGLVVARGGFALPAAVRDKLGDALWAMMMFWWIGAAAPFAGLWRRAGVALGVCVAVELSQLYHAPSVDAIRRTTLGHLVLGNGFDARDVVAYAVGVLVALTLERVLRRAMLKAPLSPSGGR